MHQLVGPDFFPGYHVCFRDATIKKGYSGVAIYSRCEPDEPRTTLLGPSLTKRAVMWRRDSEI